MPRTDLIAQLNALKEEKLSEQVEYQKAVEDFRAAQKYTDTVKKALEDIARQHREAQVRSENMKRDANRRELDVKAKADRIAALERELSRLADAEAIEDEYRRKVAAFREANLQAPWRKENRSDNMGAEEYQIDGAIAMAVADQGILADKRGLGKTLTSLIYADLVDAQKVIAIVPADTMENFIREINRWTPHRAPIQLGRMEKAKRNILFQGLAFLEQYMLVLNYEAWRKDSKLIDQLNYLRADTLILDEAHHAKTWDSSQSKGIRNIRFGMNTCPSCNSAEIKAIRNSVGAIISGECMMCGHEGTKYEFASIKHVLPMTGTPIKNRPQELFPLLHLVDPKNFYSEKEFLMDFCIQMPNRHWKWQPNGENEVVKKIGPRYLARTRESTGVVIPPQDHIIHTIPFAEMEEHYPKQATAYKQVRDFAQLVLDPDRRVTMSMAYEIVVMMRLRQVLTWPGQIELTATDEDSGEKYVVAKLDVQESIKLDRVERDIKEMLDEGERVVLFSQFKAPLEILHERLGSRSAVYNGDTDPYLRNLIQLDFDAKTTSESPKWGAVLANYRTAGEGLNLNSASQMVILDEMWNPADMSQAYGRIDRLGQTRDTQVHTYRVENTFDDWMARLIAEKSDMINGFEMSADVVQSVYQALRDGEF